MSIIEKIVRIPSYNNILPWQTAFIRPSGGGTVKEGRGHRTRTSQRELQIELTVALESMETDATANGRWNWWKCPNLFVLVLPSSPPPPPPRRLLCWLFPLCYWDLLPLCRLAKRSCQMDIAAQRSRKSGI